MARNGSAISRRQAIQLFSLTAGAAGALLHPKAILAQETGTVATILDNTLYVHPSRGADGAAGSKSSPCVLWPRRHVA